MRMLWIAVAVAFALPWALAAASSASRAAACQDRTRPCAAENVPSRAVERDVIRQDRRAAQRPGNIHRDAEIGRYTNDLQVPPCPSQPNIRDRNVVQNAPRC